MEIVCPSISRSSPNAGMSWEMWGVTVEDEDMVSLALLGLPKSWHSYQDSVNGREKLPGWERLWSDLVQEEIRRRTRDSSSSMHDEENCALVSNMKKGKGKVSLFQSSSSNDGKKTLYAMWKALKDLYQNSSDQRKLALKDKLRKIKCERDETISMYLTKLITCRDELASVGVMTSDEDMVSLALLGLPES